MDNKRSQSIATGIEEMNEELDEECRKEEAGVEQLNELMKLVGEEVRARSKKAKARHLERLQAAVAEGVARRKNADTK